MKKNYLLIAALLAMIATHAEASKPASVDKLNPQVQLSLKTDVANMKDWVIKTKSFISKVNSSKEEKNADHLKAAGDLLTKLVQTINSCQDITEDTTTACIDQINKASSAITGFENYIRRNQLNGYILNPQELENAKKGGSGSLPAGAAKKGDSGSLTGRRTMSLGKAQTKPGSPAGSPSQTKKK